MKSVDQTIFCGQRGDCLRATIASLLELPLEEVPHFVEHDDYFGVLCDFMSKHGYEYSNYAINPNRDMEQSVKETYEHFNGELWEGGSVGGFYEATVYSPKLYTKEKPVCHAVVIDKHFNIVHDPNPNYKGVKYPEQDEIGYNGVIGVTMWRKVNGEPNRITKS